MSTKPRKPARSSHQARRRRLPFIRDPFAPVGSAERRVPSTTGKLSEGTLKELLLAQERDQQGTAVDGTADAKP